MLWATKDAGWVALLEAEDAASVRAASRDARGAVDGAQQTLRPLSLLAVPGVLGCRPLPALQALHLDGLLHLESPQQLAACSALTQLTALRVGGAACAGLRAEHLAWVGELLVLRDLSVRGCAKVRLSVVAAWHPLRRLRSLALIGLAFNAADAPQLQAFLAAGPGASLTLLRLGDQRGLSFVNDSALHGLGQLHGVQLRELDLSGLIELTDGGVLQLAGLGPSLRSLHLHNCLKLGTGTALAEVVGSCLTALTALNLRGCSQLVDGQVAAMLSRLDQLQALNLQACSGLTGAFLTPGVCSALSGLRTLSLACCTALTPAHLTGLRRLKQLGQLDLAACPALAGSQALVVLGQLSSVTQLVASHWRAKGRLEAVAHASSSSGDSSGGDSSGGDSAPRLLPPQLQRLNLCDLSCSSATLEALMSKLPASLSSLDLSNGNVAGGTRGGQCLSRLGRLRQLQQLNLSGASGGLVTTHMEWLAHLTALTSLQLDSLGRAGQAAAGHHVASSSSGGGSSSDCSLAAGQRRSRSSDSSSRSSDSSGSTDSSGSVDGGSSSDASSSTTAGGWAAQPGLQLAAGAMPQQPAGVASLLSGVPWDVSSEGSDRQRSSSSVASSDSHVAVGDEAAAPATAVHRALFEEATPAPLSHEEAAQAATTAFAWLSVLQQQPRPDAPPQEQEQQQQQQQQAAAEQPVRQPPLLQPLARLRHLSVSFSSAMDDALLGELAAVTGLRSLDLIVNRKLTGVGFASWAGQPHTALTRLNLTGSSLCDAGAAHLAASCPQLRELLLPGCRALGDDGVAALAAIAGLRVLNLSRVGVTSRALAALFPAAAARPALRHVRLLNLSLCTGVCDEGLKHMGPSAAGLVELDLRGCWRITDAGVRALLSSSTSLRQLNADSCHRLSAACCPPGFAMPEGSGSNSSWWRPGVLVRRPTALTASDAA